MDKKKLKKMNLKDLITPDYNPRKIDKEQMEGLKRSLDTFGYITPIIVNEFNNHIVGDNKSSSSSKYSNILQESEKSKKLFL